MPQHGLIASRSESLTTSGGLQLRYSATFRRLAAPSGQAPCSRPRTEYSTRPLWGVPFQYLRAARETSTPIRLLPRPSEQSEERRLAPPILPAVAGLER